LGRQQRGSRCSKGKIKEKKKIKERRGSRKSLLTHAKKNGGRETIKKKKGEA